MPVIVVSLVVGKDFQTNVRLYNIGDIFTLTVRSLVNLEIVNTINSLSLAMLSYQIPPWVAKLVLTGAMAIQNLGRNVSRMAWLTLIFLLLRISCLHDQQDFQIYFEVVG